MIKFLPVNIALVHPIVIFKADKVPAVSRTWLHQLQLRQVLSPVISLLQNSIFRAINQMEKFEPITAKVMPLPMKDIDTDMIIPAQFLTSVSREGYGKNLFRRLRDKDPQFPLNQEKYKDAGIIVADSNFGCGSSREHAVWAILDAGFRGIIAKSFADIFYNNSAKNGLILVTLPERVIDNFLSTARQDLLTLTVDLEQQKVHAPNQQTFSFEYDPFRRHCILNGLDDIDYILSMKDEISKFRQQQTAQQFVSTIIRNN
jgi:3-isopropylmalate/(R)-2-methylmalate dehydratase small subunit